MQNENILFVCSKEKEKKYFTMEIEPQDELSTVNQNFLVGGKTPSEG